MCENLSFYVLTLRINQKYVEGKFKFLETAFVTMIFKFSTFESFRGLILLKLYAELWSSSEDFNQLKLWNFFIRSKVWDVFSFILHHWSSGFFAILKDFWHWFFGWGWINEKKWCFVRIQTYWTFAIQSPSLMIQRIFLAIQPKVCSPFHNSHVQSKEFRFSQFCVELDDH